MLQKRKMAVKNCQSEQAFRQTERVVVNPYGQFLGLVDDYNNETR
jgi:hypothetical protein